MSSLQSQLEAIASGFVSSILEAMKLASLSDLAAQTNVARPTGSARVGRPRVSAGPTLSARKLPATKPSGGRRLRSSAQEVQRWKDAAYAAAKSLKPGFSKGDVMKKSGSQVDLGRAIALLVADGKLTKKGDRRKTRYWVK